MPKKSDRIVPLPAGLVPLLSQPQLETYYGVSTWTVRQWIAAGMPVRRLKTETSTQETRRFDLDEVKRWHAEQDSDATAEPSLAAAGA